MDIFRRKTTEEMLEDYNRRSHTIADIWSLAGRVCPIIVRRYDEGEDAAVAVTQVCRGIAYGFPLLKGRRTRNGWYLEDDTESVRIPEAATAFWHLVDLPCDSMEQALFRNELMEGTDGADAPEGAILGRGANIDAVITFGKYRQRTVRDVIRRDPEYVAWALENIPSFRDAIYREAV